MQNAKRSRYKLRGWWGRVRVIVALCGRPVATFAREPTILQGSTVAVLLYIGALSARTLLDQVVPGRLPYVSFWPAILLASFLCGIWPTIALLFASAATMALWVVRPENEPLSFHLLLVLLFLLIGAVLVTPVFYLKALQQRNKEHDEQMALINGELKHRLRNLFAVTSAICRQSLRSKATPEEIGKLIEGRLRALAAAQDLLTITSEKCDLRSLVERITRPLTPSDSQLRITGPDVLLPTDSTTQFALVLHELATNAVKHGAWRPTSQGSVSLEWRKRNGRQLELEWCEDCVSGSSDATHHGFGSLVIKRGLRAGRVNHEISAKGVRCCIELEI
jgi:two-component sensor histidine kinase